MARPWMRSTKISLTLWVLMVVLQVVGFGGFYLVYSRHYVSTDNAQVDGDQMSINAPTAGRVVRWTIGQGSLVEAGQVVGRVKVGGTNTAPEMAIRSPGSGQIAVSQAAEGQYVEAGAQLAIAYPSGLYVTARVPADDVGEVRIGAPVDIDVDAFPDTPVTGVVTEIQNSTAGEFSVYPSPDQNVQNPQPIAEYIPVRITFTGTSGAALLPGMSVTAHIRRDGPVEPAR